jgi:hypothetical protein
MRAPNLRHRLRGVPGNEGIVVGVHGGLIIHQTEYWRGGDTMPLGGQALTGGSQNTAHPRLPCDCPEGANDPICPNSQLKINAPCVSSMRIAPC